MIESALADKWMVRSFLNRKYRKLPFPLKQVEAKKAIADREQKLSASLIQTIAEPTVIKRPVV